MFWVVNIALYGCLFFVNTCYAPLLRDITDYKQFDILNEKYDHNTITVYKFLETQKSSYILFVKDHENNHYIVKQEKSATLSKQFRAIAEALCAYITKKLAIPAQDVQIIPVGVSFPGKFITQRVATIHTLVPGDTIRSKPNGPYGKLDIKQDKSSETPSAHQGFNERTIFWMSQHPDLPLIVAADTFLGNKDRNKANMLYHEDTDTFYAIDMALMYDVLSSRPSVAYIACEQVMRMIKEKKKFSKKELEALCAYQETLKKLVVHFPPQRMCDLLDYFFEQTLIVSNSLFSDKEILCLLNLYKRSIKQSYVEIKRLIYLLFLLLGS